MRTTVFPCACKSRIASCRCWKRRRLGFGDRCPWLRKWLNSPLKVLPIGDVLILPPQVRYAVITLREYWSEPLKVTPLHLPRPLGSTILLPKIAEVSGPSDSWMSQPAWKEQCDGTWSSICVGEPNSTLLSEWILRKICLNSDWSYKWCQLTFVSANPMMSMWYALALWR